MEKIIIATDSFKGCLTSSEAAQAAASGIRKCLPEASVTCLPVSDGGDGMLDAFSSATGASIVTTLVHDPMMRPIEAEYGITADGTAIIEIARASGLTLLKPSELNPLRATSYGTGELIADGVKHGCHNFIVGLGGSATSDAGIGMLRALTDRLAPGGTIDDCLRGCLRDCHFTLACDVRNPLCGEQGAAAVFAPQKGADSAMVETLDRRARRFAEISARHFGRDLSSNPGAGAAGGLGYAFMEYLGASFRSGADYLLDLLRFDDLACSASLVVTGEGSSDRQTLMGKLPFRIMRRSLALGVSTCLLAGRIADRDELLSAGFAEVVCINPDNSSLEESMRKDVATARLAAAAGKIARSLSHNTSESRPKAL